MLSEAAAPATRRRPPATGCAPAGWSTRSDRVWHGGHDGEPELLASCYRRSLEVTDGIGAASLAFPAISTGLYGYPKDGAAHVAVDTIRAVQPSTRVERVVLVAFTAEDLAHYEALLD